MKVKAGSGLVLQAGKTKKKVKGKKTHTITPDSKLFIVSPISPHNLNVRPLIVPLTSKIRIKLRSRDDSAVFTMDNRNYTVPANISLELCSAPVRLKRMCLGDSNFINALRSRLLWGQDVRNGSESY